MRRFGWGHAIALTIAVTIVWSAGILLTGARASERVTNQDCAHGLDDRSLVKPCERQLGWHFTKYLAVTKHKVVRAWTIAPCTFEDGSGGPLPCGWNLGGMRTGDGKGAAYWIDRHRNLHYVWDGQPVKPDAAHWPSPHQRHLLDVTRACWVNRTAPHQWRHACPNPRR